MSENSSRTDTAIRRRALELWRAWFNDHAKLSTRKPSVPMPDMDTMQRHHQACYDIAIAEYQADRLESVEQDEIEHRRSL